MARLSLSVVFALLSWRAIAAPTPLEKRAVSADLLAKFNLFEQYSAASYCAQNNNSTGTEVSCEAGNCPLVDAATTNTVVEFEDSAVTDTTGFVATDSTNRLIVVSFRGSRSIQNWIANFDFGTTATTICSGCPAHSGFWNSWQEARSYVVAAVESARAANPSYQIVATGHSLGGAVATLAAADLRNSGYNVVLYTYGAPRIGPAALSDYITAQGNNYRVTHLNDPVPRLPTLNMGYVHVSPEYYISSANNAAVTTNDITTYEGNSNLSGNAKWGLNVDVNAHLWYFNEIAACE
ncbi:Lipase class 3 [Lasiodiplodia theobromae]|uniref:Mono-and diacylglycerol lipase n=1 Tax=Lasiodiplodia theobromae TaxID=45133 RepID=A0A5N5DNG3_9PEZI|nr:Lipase class 3 [Lasiodiplodia theobromae]KAB2579469.1 Mono- and diacylglycerol lipase [Lasiodiplodia theobromae]KAF4542104.1 Lipase class 3 [Lasiodiplodia theobromae]KAF9635461.1 Lipase class 3 [Lasiodiplodia theobromae]